MQNKRRFSRGESSEASSTRQKTFRENVPLQYLVSPYAEQGELLPPLMNLVGEYSGALCGALTDDGEKCVSDQYEEYKTDYGAVRCTDYCASSWQNWLLPLLTTMINDTTWAERNYQFYTAIYWQVSYKFIIDLSNGFYIQIVVKNQTDDSEMEQSGYFFAYTLELNVGYNSSYSMDITVEKEILDSATKLAALVKSCWQVVYDRIPVAYSETFNAYYRYHQPDITEITNFVGKSYLNLPSYDFAFWYNSRGAPQELLRQTLSQLYQVLIPSLKQFIQTTHLSVELHFTGELSVPHFQHLPSFPPDTELKFLVSPFTWSDVPEFQRLAKEGGGFFEGWEETDQDYLNDGISYDLTTASLRVSVHAHYQLLR